MFSMLSIDSVNLIDIGIDSNINKVVWIFIKNSVSIMIINIKVSNSVCIIVLIVCFISVV